MRGLRSGVANRNQGSGPKSSVQPAPLIGVARFLRRRELLSAGSIVWPIAPRVRAPAQPGDVPYSALHAAKSTPFNSVRVAPCLFYFSFNPADL